jgi:hypothetical protein
MITADKKNESAQSHVDKSTAFLSTGLPKLHIKHNALSECQYSDCGLNDVPSLILHGGTGETMKNLASVPAKIQTDHLLSTDLHYHLQTTLFSIL